MPATPGAVVVASTTGWRPSTRSPAGVDDAVAATRWILAHLDELRRRPTRLAVGGDSAGGNLAAVATQGRTAAPAGRQLLIYPATDASDGDYPSREENADRLLPRPADDGVVHGATYAGGAPARDRPALSPLRAPTLDGLPPAVVVTAEFDPLRDEGEAYAERWRRPGCRSSHAATTG